MTLHYALHGVRFSVDVDGPLAEEVRRAVMPGCVRARGGRGGAVFAVRREGRTYVVRRNGRRLWSVVSKAELVPWLEAEVVNGLLARLGRYVALHAAVVARRGRAVILPGAPDAGKTSLACALGLAGWGVMSDEVALVEADGAAVASFPRAMLVKSGTVRRLPELGTFPRRFVLLDGARTSVRYVDPAQVGGRIRDRARVAALAFPRWARKTRVSEVGEREALERLIRTHLGPRGRTKRAVDACVRLVRGARRFRLDVAGLRDAARALSDAIGGGR